ncbi:MAG: glycosyltransferase [Bacteroidetes bacterium]|nr:glycosyltransferase [Bacteroidota bacterium]
MPRVLRIINRLNLGGPTYNAAYLTRYLPKEYQTRLIAGLKDRSEAGSDYILEQLGVEAINIPGMYREVNLLNDRRAYNTIKEIIQDFKPDIVHTHASKAGALGRLAAINSDVPVIVHTFHGHVFHSYFGPLKTSFYLKVERWLAKRSSAIVALSEKQRDELSARFRVCEADKIHVIPLGFDLESFKVDQAAKRVQFRQQYQLDDETIAIGIVGRLVPIKDHKFFLDAIEKLLDQTKKKVRALIIGDGYLREELIAYTRSKGIKCNIPGEYSVEAPITFTSWIKEIDLVNAGLDIMALTSRNEGTPVSLIEAQAAGVPVITTRVGGVIDTVKENETAFVVESGDLKDFIEKLDILINDDTRRSIMGEKGMEFVGSRFSYQRLVSDVSNLYYDLLKR